MARVEFQNGQIKSSFRDSLIDFYNGEVDLQTLKQRELSYAKEERYFKAAGVRSLIQWLRGETETTEEELAELLKEKLEVYIIDASQTGASIPLNWNETQNELDPRDNEI
jgi:hypothetical protein